MNGSVIFYSVILKYKTKGNLDYCKRSKNLKLSYTHLIFFFLSKDKQIIDFDLVTSKFNSSNKAILLGGFCSLLDKDFRGLITSELFASVGLKESFATSRRDAYVLIKLFLFQQLQKQFPKLPIHLEIRHIIECPL